MIGIIVAEQEELLAIKSYMTNISSEEKYGDVFHVGVLNSKNECVLVLSGIGKVNASRTTQLLIDEYNPEVIINLGVAGGISERVNIGDVVAGERLVQYDFDLTAYGREKGELPDGLGKYFYSDKILMQKAVKILEEDNGINGVIGTIATGDKFVTDPNESRSINKELEADCVEMEGAAIAQVCHLCKIPFIVVRCISDSPNDNNKIDFDNFIKMASKTVSSFVVKMME